MLLKERTKIYDFNFHLVWVTKYRKNIFINKRLSNSMIEILKNIADGNGVTIQHIEVMPDHVHMMISFPPDMTPSSVVKSFKGTSARMWFKKYPETKSQLWGGHLWSPSYFMSTLGNVSKEIVTEYIENQVTKYNGGRPRH
ncbi:MAG TPA: IS200/IS605 family transposase [Companilactobacillus farciminis]|uniref:IS200/IS605 family transposase n=1 Tax=Companilactobacillus farciminis TaxID=1612 RepID=A0A921HRW6_9LACO|nr:IS200/IS605 family transposase [Companilactobacillus farciminis]WCG35845.1 IS200/IS605 family transposase [Companilactobacillus farciminis]HJF86747.1 IS200/IS605 family transposase [Companilactobacillus farciminis]